MTIMKRIRSAGFLYRSLLCFLFLFAVQVRASGQTFQWTKQFGSADWDEGIAVVTDDNGHVYSIGHFKDTLHFNPGPGSSHLPPKGSQDIFISKLDASGNLVWAKQIGGNSWNEGNAITLDNSGNIYITGSFLGTTDFDPSADTFQLSSTDDIHTFVCKLSPSGDLVWVRQMGGTLAVNTYGIAVDNSDNVYITGYFDALADLDPGPALLNFTVQGYSDIFVSKLDASGNLVWAKQMGGPSGEVGYAIAVDNEGYVYTTGVFTEAVDFDPGAGTFELSTNGAEEVHIFLSKLDASGNFVWAKQMNGQDARALAIDNMGNVYVGGSGYNNWNDIAINKFAPSGNMLWTKQMPLYMCWSLALDDDNNVYTTGNFEGTKDFDPGAGIFNLTATGNSASYISKLDASGNFVWAKHLGGTEQVWSRYLAVDGNNNVYTTGYFNGTADFDPSAATFDLTAIGSYDVFVQKIMQADNVSIKETGNEEVFRVYPNPTKGQFTNEFDPKYKDAHLVLSNILGQVVEQRSLTNSGHTELDIHGACGIYILSVYAQNGQKSTVRIVKTERD